jgi:hypothetical protein
MNKYIKTFETYNSHDIKQIHDKQLEAIQKYLIPLDLQFADSTKTFEPTYSSSKRDLDDTSLVITYDDYISLHFYNNGKLGINKKDFIKIDKENIERIKKMVNNITNYIDIDPKYIQNIEKELSV